jgi:hypothetical protein
MEPRDAFASSPTKAGVARKPAFLRAVAVVSATAESPSKMLSIGPAAPGDAAIIHEIQMRAFAEEGRLSGTVEIPPLMESVDSIELLIRTQTVLTARDGDRVVVRGNVRFYERHGYTIHELTKHGETIVLARMRKRGRGAGA